MGTHVYLVVQRTRIYARPIRAPAYRGDRAPQLVHAHGLLRALVAALPHADRPVVPAGRDELDARAAGECPVEGVDDAAVRVQLAYALPCREVGDGERVVCGDRVHELGGERPL